MPRYARQTGRGTVHHVIARFVDRAWRITGEPERASYLARLAISLAQCDARVVAYALMSNHVHLCVVSGGDALSRLIHPVHSGFAGWLNRRQGKLGPVFAERFSSSVVDGSSSARLVAYVHNNPVRAGVVDDAVDSAWTSHRSYVGAGPMPSWLDVQLGLDLCGFSASATGRARLGDFVGAHRRDPRDAELSAANVQQVRACTRGAVGAPVELTTGRVDQDGSEFGIRAPAGTPLRPRWEGSPLEVVHLVAGSTGLAPSELQSRSRVRAIADARRLALMVWRRLGRATVEMAATLGIGSSAAAHLLRRGSEAAQRMHERSCDLEWECWFRASGPPDSEK